MNLKENTKSIIGIQYLRGVASLMVVLFHARSYFHTAPEWARLGSRGVDIFFVISGFIMVYATRKIANEISPLKSCGSFLGKRFIRVVPLYWLALLITAYPYFVNWYQTASITSDLVTIFKDFSFIPHLSIVEDEKGEIFPVLIQGWTLNYEVFFYVIFGFALLTRKHRVITATLILAGLVLLGRLHHFHDIPAIFYTNTILLEFIYGMLLYEIYEKTHDLKFNQMILWSLAIVGFLLLNIGSGTNNKVVLGAASALIVWVFIQAFRDTHFRPLQVLGDASYSIYLFHLVAFDLARSIVAYFSINPSGYVNVITIVAIHVACSIVIGIAIYYFVEKPLLAVMRNGFDKVSKYGTNWFSQLSRAESYK